MFEFTGACFQIDCSCQLDLGAVESSGLRNGRCWSDGNGNVGHPNGNGNGSGNVGHPKQHQCHYDGLGLCHLPYLLFV